MIGISIFKALQFLLMGKLKKYRGIQAEIVAKAMVNLAKGNETGLHIIESDKIKEIAGI